MHQRLSPVIQCLLASLVVCLVFASAPLAYNEKKAVSLMNQGEARLDKGDFAGALKAFQELESVCDNDGFPRGCGDARSGQVPVGDRSGPRGTGSVSQGGKGIRPI